MIGLCTDCPHREICSDLCPEAELYAKQDEVPQRELTVGTPWHGKWPDPREKSLFTKRERQVLTRLIDGKNREEIAAELNTPLKNISNIISRIRKKKARVGIDEQREK